MSRLLCALLLGLTACSGASSGGGGRPEVVASFYPLAFLAREVGGTDVEVTDLTPAGTEPHDIELSPSRVARLADADLVFFLGGFQPAVEDAIEASGVDGVDLLDDITAPGDPHVWLDPAAMQELLDRVLLHVSALDTDRAADFRNRARALNGELIRLDALYETGLADCRERDLVVSHEAFGHLAARYGLEQIGISGVDPEAEPGPGRLAEVAELARERGVETIFFERLVSPDVAEALAREVGANTAVLDPIEGEPETGDYVAAMEDNLQALRDGLRCR